MSPGAALLTSCRLTQEELRAMTSPIGPRRFPALRPVALAAGLAAGASFATPALAVNNEPAECLSPDPSHWPSPSKPYVMIVFDTSAAMSTSVLGSAPPCTGFPSTVSGNSRCAVQKALQAYSGKINFGLAGMALNFSGCSGGCFSSCSYTPWIGDSVQSYPNWGCGSVINGVRHGANILVPMLQDHYWQTTPPTCTSNADCPTGICSGGACQSSNTASLVNWMDNSCTSQELWAMGKSPYAGVLNDLYAYFSGSYLNWGNGQTLPSPLDTGTPSNERSCRPVNVLVIGASDDTCDGTSAAKAAAAALYNGVTVGGINFNIRTHVIAWPGGANLGQIAGTYATSTHPGVDGGHGYLANVTTYSELSTALSSILDSTIPPETCDNVDNNCNGCTDEGFQHYCNIQPNQANCCTQGRATCLANYEASITAANPSGDRSLLPCIDSQAGTTPATWLCYDPKEQCDDVDNNCNGQTDEGFTKCGSPLHCPQAETCNDQDDDCDGVVDDAPGGGPYSICPVQCPVTCSALDQCHDVGTCDPVTGMCSNPPKQDGAPCDDGNACTQLDTCQAGVCQGASPVVCNAPDECHEAGTCDTTTGQCASAPKADGTACTAGTCAAGVCVATTSTSASTTSSTSATSGGTGGGSTTSSSATTTTSASSGGMGGASASSGIGAGGEGPPGGPPPGFPHGEKGGCACSSAGGGEMLGGAWLAALGLVLAAARRRRNRGEQMRR
jgi:MYXO-CTERM domain-containing protein